MRNETMIKATLLASLLSVGLSAAALFYAMSAAESADDAYGAAVHAASNAEEAGDKADEAKSAAEDAKSAAEEVHYSLAR